MNKPNEEPAPYTAEDGLCDLMIAIGGPMGDMPTFRLMSPSCKTIAIEEEIQKMRANARPLGSLDSLLPLCIPVDKLDAAMVQSASWKVEQVRSYILELRRISGTPLGDAK